VKHESQQEIQLRLHHEKECRRIAELVKKELPEDRGFILVTATVGGGPNATLSSTDYVSTCERDDAARLLTELLDHWRNEGTGCEPTVETATKLRELVYDARRFSPVDLVKAVKLGVKEIDRAMAKESISETLSAALVVSGTALALIDSFEQFQASERRGVRDS
jgi:hypothetical protein